MSRGATITARANTLAGAVEFVRACWGSPDGPLFGPCVERDGRYVIDVYDWLECWFAAPPVHARIIAPRGFTPRDDGGGRLEGRGG